MLQSKSADLSIAAILIENCIKKLAKKREQVDKFFVKMRQEASELCTKHGIKEQLKDNIYRRKKRMADENCDAFKTKTWHLRSTWSFVVLT